jgi:cytochrome c-type biogenesis protein
MEEHLTQLLESAITQKALWAFIIALAGGIISSLSPCTLSILPIMAGYIGGYSEDKISRAFFNSLLFVAGFTITLTAVGLIAALAGKVMGAFIGPYWFVFLAVICILMGLGLLEAFYIQIPRVFKEMPERKYGKILSPVILGLVFGTMATPCSTPILITILSFVAYEGSIVYGSLMLVAYAIGHSILLLLTGTFTGVIKQIGHVRHWGFYINKVSGVMLILIGIYLFLYSLFPKLRFF